jgi:hypothetical protein
MKRYSRVSIRTTLLEAGIPRHLRGLGVFKRNLALHSGRDCLLHVGRWSGCDVRSLRYSAQTLDAARVLVRVIAGI